MAQQNNNSPALVTNAPKVKQMNQFLKIDESEIIPFDQELIVKEEPEIDYSFPQLSQYFSKKVHRNGYQSLVNNIVKMCHQNFKEQIKAGHTSVSPESKVLSNLASAQLKKQQEQLSKSRTSDLSPPPHHKQFIERMKKARKANEQKRRLKLEYQESKKESLLKKQQEQRRQYQQKLRLEKERLIKERLDEKSKEKDKQKEERMEAVKRYKSVISQKRRHELMAEKYEKKIVQPLLEERNKILQARSKRLKGYSIDQIRNFQQEYNRKEQEKASMSSFKAKQQWNYIPPPIQPRLHQIIEEQKVKERMRLEEKKRALEEKIARQQHYAQYLKESIIVKVDQKKKEELEKLNAKQQRKTKSKSERWMLGNHYLTEVRNKLKSELKNKKDNYSTQQQSQKLPQATQKLKSNTSMGKHHDYQKQINIVHQQRINRLLSSNTIDSNRKLSQLKNQVNKLNERAKWKEQMDRLKPGPKDNDYQELEMLLSNIKAKIGIMSLYRN